MLPNPKDRVSEDYGDLCVVMHCISLLPCVCDFGGVFDDIVSMSVYIHRLYHKCPFRTVVAWSGLGNV